MPSLTATKISSRLPGLGIARCQGTLKQVSQNLTSTVIVIIRTYFSLSLAPSRIISYWIWIHFLTHKSLFIWNENLIHILSHLIHTVVISMYAHKSLCLPLSLSALCSLNRSHRELIYTCKKRVIYSYLFSFLLSVSPCFTSDDLKQRPPEAFSFLAVLRILIRPYNEVLKKKKKKYEVFLTLLLLVHLSGRQI